MSAFLARVRELQLGSVDRARKRPRTTRELAAASGRYDPRVADGPRPERPARKRARAASAPSAQEEREQAESDGEGSGEGESDEEWGGVSDAESADDA